MLPDNIKGCARLLVVAVFLWPTITHAESFLFAEIQLGWKNPGSTSAVMRSGCTEAFVTAFGNRGWSSCGGRNPAFSLRAGWEFDGKRFSLMKNVKVGIHHFSHVRDGTRNNRPETHMDEIFISKKWGGIK